MIDFQKRKANKASTGAETMKAHNFHMIAKGQNAIRFFFKLQVVSIRTCILCVSLSMDNSFTSEMTIDKQQQQMFKNYKIVNNVLFECGINCARSLAHQHSTISESNRRRNSRYNEYKYNTKK